MVGLSKIIQCLDYTFIDHSGDHRNSSGKESLLYKFIEYFNDWNKLIPAVLHGREDIHTDESVYIPGPPVLFRRGKDIALFPMCTRNSHLISLKQPNKDVRFLRQNVYNS